MFSRNHYAKTIALNFCALMLLSILPFGCSNDDDSIKPIDIKGEWTWIESVGGFGGWTLTPESEDITKRLIIDDFVYQEFWNDSLVLDTGYEIKLSEETLVGTEDNTIIEFDSGDRQAIVIVDSNLELIDQCIDCYSHRYRRN